MHELADSPEATLAELLKKVSPCQLVLVEGFKTERHPKLEVFRQVVGKPALYTDDARIVGVASDQPLVTDGVPVINLDDVSAVGEFILQHAELIARVLAALEARADGA